MSTSALREAAAPRTGKLAARVDAMPRIEARIARSKSDLVVFGEDWGRHPSSTQHLVRHLPAGRRVIWVESVGLRRPRLNLNDAARAASKLTRLVPGLRRSGPATGTPAGGEVETALPEGLTVLPPRAIPWPGNSAAFAMNRILLGRQVSAALAARGMARPVLWISIPSAYPVVGQIGERALVYYCCDDFGSLAGVDHGPVMEMEAGIVAKADLVIAASPMLAARLPAQKTILVPHGADIGLFTAPAARADDLPRAPRIAGFYGSLQSWIDVDMLATVAGRMPDWVFVFIGQVDTDVSALKALPNVVLLGRKPHAELPRYSRHWTVSMLPFRDTPQIRACNPLKLREYLAAGRPIVSTDFPALDGYRDLIRVATTPDDFAAALTAAATEADRADERRARVAGETWQARAREVDSALESL